MRTQVRPVCKPWSRVCGAPARSSAAHPATIGGVDQAPPGHQGLVAEFDDRLTTPVQLEDAELARVKAVADRDLEALARASKRYAALYVAHRTGELPEEPDPSAVGCDEHAAVVARAVVEQALNAEILHGGAGGDASD
jgi:hypothetical protein